MAKQIDPAKVKLTVTGERFIPGDPHFDLDAHEHYARYAFATFFAKGIKVLDAACGCGYGSFMLAESGAKQVTAMDKNNGSINFAKDSYKRSNLVFYGGDILYVPEDNGEFDLVVAFETIEHIKENKQFLKEVKRLLKKNGLFLASVPNSSFFKIEGGKSWSASKFHVGEYTERDLSQLLSPFFKNYLLIGQNHFPDSSGTSAIGKDGKLFVFSDEMIEVSTDGKFTYRGRVEASPKAAESQFIIVIASDAELKWPFSSPKPVCNMNEEKIFLENLKYLLLKKENHIENLERHVRNLERHVRNLESIVKNREKEL
ncbi:MAG: class I SAM-dependent methyltransferase [Candidatus Omnitrophica bacterium]|nr:class I SAM-dependent methyltransferase [Candidatus Omnitrophota bacterium]